MSKKIMLFLRFDDWISSKTHLQTDWVTVARFDRSSNNSFGTFSSLVPNDPEITQNLLQNWTWDVHTNFGTPYFSQSFTSGQIEFNMGDKELKNGIPFESFTILREFHTAYPSHVDITQSFVLYHGLYHDTNLDKYLEPISEESVIVYEDHCFVLAKVRFIRDYLAARNMILVRFHDHRRTVNKSLNELIGKNRAEYQIIEKDRHFHIAIAKGFGKVEETRSRLLGKDIILPFEEPMNNDYLFLAGKEKSRFVKFIIDIDDKGKLIEEICSEEELSNNFADRGKPHFLTLVFFKREVLQKFYQNPRKYTVGSGYINCLDLWGIPFGVNREGFLHVWLGDLGRIPYEEQLHFRQYNVLPSGGISEDFYKTQLLAQSTETKNPMDKIKQLYNEIGALSEKKLGFRIFKELSEDDSHILKTIHIPTTTEWKELDEQLVFLAKLLPDSINKSELGIRLAWNPRTSDENNRISFLEKFLEELFKIDSKSTEQIVRPIRVVQSLRSASAAHKKSKRLRKLLKKLGLEKKNPQEISIILVSSLAKTMSVIRDLLSAYSR